MLGSSDSSDKLWRQINQHKEIPRTLGRVLIATETSVIPNSSVIPTCLVCFLQRTPRSLLKNISAYRRKKHRIPSQFTRSPRTFAMEYHGVPSLDQGPLILHTPHQAVLALPVDRGGAQRSE